MSKTFKLGGIMLTSIVGLQVIRLLFSYLNLSDNLSSWLFSTAIQCVCLGVVPYVLYRTWIAGSNADFVRDVRLNKRISPVSYLLAIAVGLLGYVINIGASTVSYTALQLLGYTYAVGGGTIYSGPEVLILEIVTGAMFPAFFEEITNRGVLLAALDNEKSDRVKIIFMGVFFGVFHQNVPQFFPTMIIGVIIAYMAVKSQSILPGMIVHFINNFVITLSSYGSQTGSPIGQITNFVSSFVYSNVIVLALSVAVAVWLIIICLRRFAAINVRYREERDPAERRESGIAEPSDEDVRARIGYIYGYPAYNADYDAAVEKPNSVRGVLHAAEAGANDGKNKVSLKDHILLITAFVSATIVTIFTYIWGILR